MRRLPVLTPFGRGGSPRKAGSSRIVPVPSEPRSKPRLLRDLSRFWHAGDGMIATEFALVLPFLVTLYFGMLTFTDGFALKQRVQSVARTAADLVGRLPASSSGGPATVNATEITNVAKAAAAVLAPYDPSGASVTLASVVVRLNSGKPEGRVCWSAARRIDSRSSVSVVAAPAYLAQNAVVTVPAGFQTPGMAYLVSEVKHVYRPIIGHAIMGDVTFADQVPWPVRTGQQVAWQGQAPCPVN
jgi:Flp pilus assembly protein TadG